jgi:hypothetical protein
MPLHPRESNYLIKMAVCSRIQPIEHPAAFTAICLYAEPECKWRGNAQTPAGAAGLWIEHVLHVHRQDWDEL